MFDTTLWYFLILIFAFVTFYKINKLKTKNSLTTSNIDSQLDRVIAFLEETGGNHLSHLILLQDKDVYWAVEEQVLIVYKRIGNKIVVLGDPIGPEALVPKSIKEFQEYGVSKGLKPIFYQISPRFMHLYHDTGYRFLKLGEEGVVNLHNFSIEGKQGAKLRTRVNKFTRNSYTFSVIMPPYSKAILSELKEISDSWLGNQKEKGFSVVSFSEEYVSCFPVALLYDPEGKVLAFATLATDHKKSITIDLMRKFPNSPHGTMDVLFIQIFKWAKENGYLNCSLGMAPLSNVGDCKFSFQSEKFIRLAYLHGNSMYNFKGLKEFKSKFASGWEPKYLAYRETFLPVVIIQLLLLINSTPHPKSVVDKIKYLMKKTG
ncbi:phosphatidylglycerol lysyltransferase domain-containing protein [Neobacillus sp. 3P2-tot-E-2]|uniref:phosphatidylglycerol lysyltransferase domain-containing protein n=1 Tax=Neobacillus sp. 3P2-tot-E-2 TaxID=3132212 RepID=UPI0039A0ACA3